MSHHKIRRLLEILPLYNRYYIEMQMKQAFKHWSDEYTYNHRHNMLELRNILEKFRMATSKAVLDI